MKNKTLLEHNGHYWLKSKHDNSIEIGKYSAKTKKHSEGFSLIGSGFFMHVDNYEVISDIILRETT